MESAMLLLIAALGALAGRTGGLKLPKAWPLVSLLF